MSALMFGRKELSGGGGTRPLLVTRRDEITLFRLRERLVWLTQKPALVFVQPKPLNNKAFLVLLGSLM